MVAVENSARSKKHQAVVFDSLKVIFLVLLLLVDFITVNDSTFGTHFRNTIDLVHLAPEEIVRKMCDTLVALSN